MLDVKYDSDSNLAAINILCRASRVVVVGGGSFPEAINLFSKCDALQHLVGKDKNANTDELEIVINGMLSSDEMSISSMLSAEEDVYTAPVAGKVDVDSILNKVADISASIKMFPEFSAQLLRKDQLIGIPG